MNRMYILVRRDLEPAHQAVQACHAVAELMAHHSENQTLRSWALNDRTMVLLGVQDEYELSRWEAELAVKNIGFKTFIEPDRNDEKTAMAVIPTDDQRLFKKLDLLRI